MPETAKGAKQARDILAKYHIDINSAVNGVFLPTRKNTDTLSGILHNGRHPDEYIEAVTQRLKAADKQKGYTGVIEELNKMKQLLSQAERYSDWRTVLT